MSEYLPKYDRIAKAIGKVCMSWGSINAVVHDIVLHLGYCVAPNIQDTKAFNVLHITTAHMEERQLVAVAKSLASEIKPYNSPDFYRKTEKLLNYVDNDLRPERNRFVHDHWEWQGDEDAIVRVKAGPRVIWHQSRDYRLAAYSERQYQNIEEVEAFVMHLDLVYDDLVELDNHLAWLLGQIEQPSELLQPLPQEWKSLAHRDWRGPDTPRYPSRASPK